MSRLTKQLREKMLAEVLDHAFAEKQKQATSELILAGEKIYLDVYGDHLEAMSSLPKGWLQKSSNLSVAIAGQRHSVDHGKSKLIGYDHYGKWQSAKLYVGDEQVAIDYLKANEKVQDLKDQRSNMCREVNAVLESVHTFKKLWEVWPECKSLLEKFEQKPAIAILPAVQVHRLNAALGLPVGEVPA
ncbi:Nmad5 family putative nucleotide modification protein [Acinetobacter indicus]|uniref:Nucleotide modification associated domain-containing protein n=1 Tax=Acinetobacter indicus TaxID=756892 RepID=A0A6C0Y0W9_9GAMM|nr:Nmad5 family putative nucleotide modification protein [Acinetobacter indicus]QIC69778.1 hypothetical protein FSC09_04860 [Acinetobacter indicus]